MVKNFFPSVSDAVTWGRYKGQTYAALAKARPSWCKWAATNIHPPRGALCAEALALALGIR